MLILLQLCPTLMLEFDEEFEIDMTENTDPLWLPKRFVGLDGLLLNINDLHTRCVVRNIVLINLKWRWFSVFYAHSDHCRVTVISTSPNAKND